MKLPGLTLDNNYKSLHVITCLRSFGKVCCYTLIMPNHCNKKKKKSIFKNDLQ